MEQPAAPTTLAGGQRQYAAIIVASMALFTDMFIYGLAIPVLPLLSATAGAGQAATGLLFAIYAAGMIAVTPLAGRLVDRRGTRMPLLVGMFGLAAATLLFAVGNSYWLLLVARGLQGVSAAMSWVAGLSLIASATPLATRGRYMGLAMSTVMLGVLLGPPVSGVIAARYGAHAPFLAAIALAVVDSILRVVLVRPTPTNTDDPAGPLTVLRVSGSKSVVVAVVLGAGVLAAIEPVLPLHLTQAFRAGPLTTGLLFGLVVLVGTVFSPIVGALVGKLGAHLLIRAGIVMAATALLGLGLSQHYWQLTIGMGVLGLANACILSPATTLIGVQGQRSVPPALGGSYALFNLAYAGGLTAGPLLSGIATGALGFTAGVSVLAAIVVGSGLVSLRQLPTFGGD